MTLFWHRALFVCIDFLAGKGVGIIKTISGTPCNGGAMNWGLRVFDAEVLGREVRERGLRERFLETENDRDRESEVKSGSKRVRCCHRYRER